MRCFIAISLLTFGGFLAGCSGGSGDEDRLDVYKVTGKVTFAGSPVANATVTYSPVDSEKGRAAIGRTNDDGVYSLRTYEADDGATPGEYVVLVTANTSSSAATSDQAAHDQYLSGGGPSSHGGGGGSGSSDESILPEKYSSAATSDLKKTVESKDNVIDLELKP